MSYVSAKITPAARDALRRITLDLSAHVGRQLTMSDALSACVTVARKHPDELRQAASAATTNEGADQ